MLRDKSCSLVAGFCIYQLKESLCVGTSKSKNHRRIACVGPSDNRLYAELEKKGEERDEKCDVNLYLTKTQ